MSGRELAVWWIGFVVGALVGVGASLLFLPPDVPSLLLGMGMGALAAVLAMQVVELAQTIRRGRGG